MNSWIQFISLLNLSMLKVINNEKVHHSLLCNMCRV